MTRPTVVSLLLVAVATRKDRGGVNPLQGKKRMKVLVRKDGKK